MQPIYSLTSRANDPAFKLYKVESRSAIYIHAVLRQLGQVLINQVLHYRTQKSNLEHMSMRMYFRHIEGRQQLAIHLSGNRCTGNRDGNKISS